ncbi:MAG TPA: hypothetical protein VFB34_10105 [Chloroflexota bacterium]|nr:hypothetical protein [Chloroflexota bacterium]
MILVAGVAVVAIIAVVAGIAATRVFGPAGSSPAKITTGSTSHIHALIVNADGSLILGDQDGLWHGDAGGGHWRTYGPPVSNLMPISVARMGSTFLAGTTTLSNKLFGAPHGLFRSTDGGRHWKRAALPDLDVLRLATNPAVPDVVVAFAGPDSNHGVGHGGIWASSNRGSSWQRINAAVGNQAENGLILLPGHPFTVLFASTFNISRSSDGGRTWHTVGTNMPEPLALANALGDPRAAYAGAADGVWVSADAGSSWHLAWHGPPAPVVSADGTGDLYVYAGGLKPDLYRLVDATRSTGGPGLKFAAVRLSNPVPSAQPIVLVPDPSHRNRVYVSYNFPLRLYVSADAGRAWKQML